MSELTSPWGLEGLSVVVMGAGGGGIGTGEGIIGGADNFGTEKCALTSRPVRVSEFLVVVKDVLRVSKPNGIRKAASKLVW
jgi:hypothetical protein